MQGQGFWAAAARAREHVSAHHMPGRTLPGRLGLGHWELWVSSQASCSRVVAMVHGVVNEQLLRFAEQHVQDMYGEEWV